ncbi:MAG: hypothetical protein KC931_22810, partial [Candidatus Omnitrophica bacterium]|nr:hypothetical protein [Candidatus Omnitrophota bacterium]
MASTPNTPSFTVKSLMEKALCLLVGLSLPMGIVWLTGCQLPTANYQPVADGPGSSIGATTLGSPKATQKKPKMKLAQNTPGFLKMNHQLHIVEQGISCEDCHSIGSTGRPEFPDHDTCSICHDIDIDAPNEDCMLCHVLDPSDIAAGAFEEIEVIHVPEHTSDFHFDHSDFADNTESCAQ